MRVNPAGGMRKTRDKPEAQKYKPSKDPLEIEAAIPVIKPGDQQFRKAVLRVLDAIEQSEANNPEIIQAVRLHRASFAVDDAQLTAQNEFLKRFWCWLVGRGTDEDTARTQWGRANIAALNDEVAAYIELFINKRLEYALKIARMLTRTPRTLNEYYLYFKYIVNGKVKRVEDPVGSGNFYMDFSDDDYLRDFEIMHSVFKPDVADQDTLLKQAPLESAINPLTQEMKETRKCLGDLNASIQKMVGAWLGTERMSLEDRAEEIPPTLDGFEAQAAFVETVEAEEAQQEAISFAEFEELEVNTVQDIKDFEREARKMIAKAKAKSKLAGEGEETPVIKEAEQRLTDTVAKLERKLKEEEEQQQLDEAAQEAERQLEAVDNAMGEVVDILSTMPDELTRDQYVFAKARLKSRIKEARDAIGDKPLPRTLERIRNIESNAQVMLKLREERLKTEEARESMEIIEEPPVRVTEAREAELREKEQKEIERERKKAEKAEKALEKQKENAAKQLAKAQAQNEKLKERLAKAKEVRASLPKQRTPKAEISEETRQANVKRLERTKVKERESKARDIGEKAKKRRQESLRRGRTATSTVKMIEKRKERREQKEKQKQQAEEEKEITGKKREGETAPGKEVVKRTKVDPKVMQELLDELKALVPVEKYEQEVTTARAKFNKLLKKMIDEKGEDATVDFIREANKKAKQSIIEKFRAQRKKGKKLAEQKAKRVKGGE